MYLEKILASKTKINILYSLVQRAGESFMESRLAEETGSSVSEVNRQIGDLVNVGLVRMERVGKAKLYTINKQHFLFSPLRTLFRDLLGVYRQAAGKIVSYLTKKHKPISIILFGSVARGKIRSDILRNPSDIDILIIANKKDVRKIQDDLRRFIGGEIATRYGIAAYPIVLSKDEYVKGLEKDQFIIDVHARGEVLYGKKPRRFG